MVSAAVGALPGLDGPASGDGLPAVLLVDEYVSDPVPSAWAIPEPPASAAPRPNVIAPAPSQV